MSHWLYLHKDLTGEPGVWKPGTAKTPYSANRLRQRLCWKQHQLDYLWFGFPQHVLFLEKEIKEHFHSCSGAVLNSFGTQTELFKVDIIELRHYIDTVIKKYNLCVREIILKEPYTATSSGQCPFGIPGENDADYWLSQKADKLFEGRERHLVRGKRFTKFSPQFNVLFESC
jgi:hypothetical protein